MKKFFQRISKRDPEVIARDGEVIAASVVSTSATPTTALRLSSNSSNLLKDTLATATHVSVGRECVSGLVAATAGPFIVGGFYFELSVTALAPDNFMWIGVNKVFVLSSGTVAPVPAFGVGDTIGCGVTTAGKVFFTANGRYLGSTAEGSAEGPWTVSVKMTPGVAFGYNFGARRFVFSPTLTREPTASPIGETPAARFVCGPMVSVGVLEGGKYDLRNTSSVPAMGCVPGRESKVQMHPPLTARHPHPYFEVRIAALPVGTTIGIGLADEYTTQQAYVGLPGWSPGEVGLHSDDLQVYNGKGTGVPIGKMRPCVVGDVLGCGVDAMFRVFFTRNGEYLGAPCPTPVDMARLCFTVGLDAATAVTLVTGGDMAYRERVAAVVSAPTAPVPNWVAVSDVLRRVLEYLPRRNLVGVNIVCSHFHDAATSDVMWRPMFLSRCGTHPDPSGQYMSWYYHYQSVDKKESLEKLEHDLLELVCKKPVVYLYGHRDSETTLVDVEVALSHEASQMWYTYPEPSSANREGVVRWERVVVKRTALEVRGDDVPYLFWEAGIGGHPVPILTRGQSVAIAALPSYLAKALPALGLRGLEVSDFIAYWAVQVAQRYRGGQVTVNFLTDAVVDKHIAKLRVVGRGGVEVKILRVYVAFEEAYDNNNDTLCPAVVDRWEPEYAGQVLAVEWGGMML